MTTQHVGFLKTQQATQHVGNLFRDSTQHEPNRVLGNGFEAGARAPRLLPVRTGGGQGGRDSLFSLKVFSLKEVLDGEGFTLKGASPLAVRPSPARTFGEDFRE